MCRWNLLFLVALLAVLAAVLPITPSRAMAATLPSMNFSGKVVAKISDTNYFVDTFTCSASKLTSKWFYEVDSMDSYYGTLVPGTTCALLPANGGVSWSTATSSPDGSLVVSPLTATLMLAGIAPPPTLTPTLTLFLTDVGAHKTFLSDTTVTMTTPCTTTSRCIEVYTTNFGLANNFDSRNGGNASLTLSVG